MNPESITSGARTVAHLADHLAELRRRAQSLRETFGVRERGYFTPTEDEQVRHLLVSYWQSRSALFEVLHRFRQELDHAGAIPEPLRERLFLVGYAAAILLVDAARSMRENFSSLRVLVDKINEGEPHFGIPPGVYDTVQKSLTSPTHAWHLYHANEYFDEHRSSLVQNVSGDLLFEPLLRLVDTLGGRVRVSKRDYVKARAKVRAELAVRAVKDRGLAKAISWVLELGCRLVSNVTVRPGHEPGLPPRIRDPLGTLLQPGDVFITRKEYAATNYFLPGFWPHAALYLGDPSAFERLGLVDHQNVKPRWKRLLELDPDEPRRVLEAMGDGVWLRSIRSPFAVDAVAVIRPRLATEQLAEALGRGLFHEGKPYDFDFDFTRSDRLVCTEVVYRSYEGIGGLRFRLTPRAGRLTLAAEDLLRMTLDREGFEPVAVFAPGCNKELVIGEDADGLIRSTLGERSP